MALWILAFRNLWRNPRRTLVTGVAMAMGFTGLSIFSGYVHRIERALAVGAVYLNNSGHVAIMKKEWIEQGLSKPRTHSLNIDDQTSIKRFLEKYNSEIAYQAPLFIGLGLISNGCRSVPFLLTGLSSATRLWTHQNPDFLKWNQKGKPQFFGTDFTHFKDDESPLMLTANLARLLNKKNIYTDLNSVPPAQVVDCQTKEGKAILSVDPTVQLMTKTFDGGLNAIDANIVGHYSMGLAQLDDMSIQGPLSLAQKLFDTNVVSRWMVFLKNDQTIETWQNVIRPEFEKQFPNLEMLFFTESRLNPFYVGTSGFLSSLTMFFVIISGVAIALAIINSLTINIIERSKEIGTLRALGFTESKLAWLFGREMILLTLSSLTFGQVFTIIVATIINQSNVMFSPPGASGPIKLEIALNFEFQVIVFAILAGMVSLLSFYLSRRQMRINIAKLLIET